MNIGTAINRMLENPGLHMTQRVWFNHEYVYFHINEGRFLTESGDVWDIGKSVDCREIDDWADWNC